MRGDFSAISVVDLGHALPDSGRENENRAMDPMPSGSGAARQAFDGDCPLSTPPPRRKRAEEGGERWRAGGGRSATARVRPYA